MMIVVNEFMRGARIQIEVARIVPVTALYKGWEEPLASELRGVYLHEDKRPLLGRKFHNKFKQVLRELGLADGDE